MEIHLISSEFRNSFTQLLRDSAQISAPNLLAWHSEGENDLQPSWKNYKNHPCVIITAVITNAEYEGVTYN